MCKLMRIVAALLIGVSTSAVAAPSNVFVKVNGSPVSQTVADAFVAEQVSRGVPDSPELRNAVREELIRRELLLQQAKAAKLDKNPTTMAQAKMAEQAVFIRSYIQQYINANPIGDDQLQAEYAKIKAQVGNTEYKARHILVKEEPAAKAIIAQLRDDPGKFSELAKQSEDPGSKDRGGDLGWGAATNYVKPFADALTALGKGNFTETPVQSQFGYHIILLEDTRPLVFPSFEEVKPRLLQQAQQQKINQMIEDLRTKAKIEE